jgi:MFS family permease
MFLHRIAPEDRYPLARLACSLALMTIGGCGMYVVVVVLPQIQADFGVDRGMASLPYAMTMIGFGLGGIVMGRLADRRGVQVPVRIGVVCLGAGFVAAGFAPNLWLFTLAHGVLIGLLGCSATFAPLVADTSLWFDRRRGIAVAVTASGNYLAGAVWPLAIQPFLAQYGWRALYVGIGVFCVLTMLPLSAILRRRPPAVAAAEPVRMDAGAPAVAGAPARTSPASAYMEPAALGLSPGALQTLLSIAGVACCVAMSMPQVHIVAYCADLGYGPARGAQMLSLMLAFGVASRLISGVICDRIGGLRTLLLGAGLQGLALLLFLPFDGLAQLYVISALFGLFQGGIVPSYAIIVREHYPPNEAGGRVGFVLMATLVGMALGGWMSGKIFDLTGSYAAAFVNGIAWNLLNLSIGFELLRRRRRAARAGAIVESPIATVAPRP